MLHLPVLIIDLGLILSAAAATTLIFKKIKQPLVLGYILAGLLVGPHISLLPTVADESGVHIWADIGVIFLLFNLGLEFSFKKLVKVGGSASITALVEIVFMLSLGYFTGKSLNWSTMDSIFLGGMLSISSTTIIIRAFEEQKIKNQKFVSLVLGVLIVQDIMAILLLVLLSTLAVSQQLAGTAMLISILKLGFFLVLWFLMGVFLVPTFFNRTLKLMNDETMLIVSLALCLLMVLSATGIGFSSALGAFIMGAILAETRQAEHIQRLTKPVKNLFAAVFFVSVGMLLDPSVLLRYTTPVLVITVVTMLGQSLSATIGALLARQPLKHAIQVGLSFSQIGEFSFIIATLGLTLHVTSDFLYPIAVAVSAVTTFTTPYMMKLSTPLYNFIERKLPQKWLESLHHRSANRGNNMVALSDWKVLLKSYLYEFVINSVVIIGIILLSFHYLGPFVKSNISNKERGTLITIILSLLAMLPFLWALSAKKVQKEAYKRLWFNRKSDKGSLIIIEIFRVFLAICYVWFLLDLFLNTWSAIGLATGITILVLALFSRKLKAFYNILRRQFLVNLHERDDTIFKESFAPDSTQVVMEFRVHKGSKLVGKTLKELAWPEQYGVYIILIKRSSKIIPTPNSKEELQPEDCLTLMGTDDQLAEFKLYIVE